MNTRRHIDMQTHANVHALCTCVRVCMHTSMRVFIHTNTSTHKHACTQAHAHTCGEAAQGRACGPQDPQCLPRVHSAWPSWAGAQPGQQRPGSSGPGWRVVGDALLVTLQAGGSKDGLGPSSPSKLRWKCMQPNTPRPPSLLVCQPLLGQGPTAAESPEVPPARGLEGQRGQRAGRGLQVRREGT